jgi:hypothetical protein
MPPTACRRESITIETLNRHCNSSNNSAEVRGVPAAYGSPDGSSIHPRT